MRRRKGAPSPIVTLLTDFGTADGYVGAMKGVLASFAPDARIVDITHEIRAGDIRAGALALEAAAAFYPSGTIHVAVVDPGVGTARRAVAIEAEDCWFVGPDNGLLTLAARRRCRVLVLDRARTHRAPVSPTFHGRDVFAPVAARLAGGVSPARLGTATTELVELDLPVPLVSAKRISGHVIHADRFGNLITNITSADLARLGGSSDRRRFRVEVGRKKVSGGLARTYGDVRSGELLALVGSAGRLEIARRDGSAAAALRHRPGSTLAVHCMLGDRG